MRSKESESQCPLWHRGLLSRFDWRFSRKSFREIVSISQNFLMRNSPNQHMICACSRAGLVEGDDFAVLVAPDREELVSGRAVVLWERGAATLG